MPRNDAAAPLLVCPGIRIHAIDIVQPPGITIPPIADMEPHQRIVNQVLTEKSSTESPKNALWEIRSERIRVTYSEMQIAVDARLMHPITPV